MAKKTWRAIHSKFFAEPLNVHTVDEVKNAFATGVASLNEAGGLKFLDGRKLSQQTVVNVLLLWFARSIQANGAGRVARELEPVLGELSLIVAEDMKRRGRRVDPEYLPEGFSSSSAPKTVAKPGKTRG